MEGFLVERYWPGVTADDVGALNARLDVFGGAAATFAGSILVPADEVVLFEFRAVDSDAVLALCRRAGLRCDRIVPATHLLGEAGPEHGSEQGPELGT